LRLRVKFLVFAADSQVKQTEKNLSKVDLDYAFTRYLVVLATKLDAIALAGSTSQLMLLGA
jgi:hypothetical protein